MTWYDKWYDMIWYDMTWYDMTSDDMTWHDMTQYDAIQYDTTRYNTIWNDMIWYMIYAYKLYKCHKDCYHTGTIVYGNTKTSKVRRKVTNIYMSYTYQTSLIELWNNPTDIN